MEINADLANANFQGTILTDAIFNNCDLTNTILCDSDLTNVKFNDCTFIGTDFRGANLHYTDSLIIKIMIMITIKSPISKIKYEI